MKSRVLDKLDLEIARARFALSILAAISLYIDPATFGGMFHLSELASFVLACHLAYSVAVLLMLKRGAAASFLPPFSMVLDVLFSAVIAVMTEGKTSPSYLFFVFAIVAAAVRPGLRSTIAVTGASVALYLTVIGISDGLSGFYLMRAVYLAIAGYLIGFIGQQRAALELQARSQEIDAERHLIARSLHDGYVQALAGVNLRLETSRELLARNRVADAQHDLAELQKAVAHEYDEVRAYIRSLAGIEAARNASLPPGGTAPRLRLQAQLETSVAIGEHLLQIILEGIRNARRHALANTVTVIVREQPGSLLLTIDDDGGGFGDVSVAPWAIQSRVAELGGQLTLSGAGSARLKIVMPNN